MSGPALRHYGPGTRYGQLRVMADDGCALQVHVLHEAATATPSVRAPAVPVVFVHALAMDGNMWHGVAEALAGPASLYALDCRGHGLSDAPPGAFTTGRFARDLVDTLDALGASRAHIVGCSMGGTVALALAGQYPERVASLTVIDATAWYGAQAPANWEKRAHAALTDGMASLVGFQLARWFSPAFLQQQPDLVRESVAVFTANRVPAYASSCRMLGQADERAGLAYYTGPAVVVVGEEDYATPLAMAQDMVSRLAGASLAVIPGTRHYTPLEAPEKVAACVRDAIGRAAKPTGTEATA